MTDDDIQKIEGEDKDPPPNDKEVTKELIEFIKDHSQSVSFSSFPFEQKKQEGKPKPKQSPPNIQFEYTPKEVKAYLDRFVIKQDEAKKTLAVAVCDHYNHIKAAQKNEGPQHYVKQNVILTGPTGVGKTFMVECIAKLVGVPFIKSDATKFTETGYVGSDVEDLIRQLNTKADNNPDLAQYGIIYIDEIDKITGSTTPMGKDVGGRGVQSNLLKLLEETEVPLKAPWDIQSQFKGMMSGDSDEKDTLNTKHILFVVSGAFQGLDDMIRKRVGGSSFGFERGNKKISEAEVLSQVTNEDFIKFGFEPEFIGRLPVRSTFEILVADDLYQILKESESSLVYQYIAAFKGYDIDLTIKDDALKELASQAAKEKTGARGLSTVFERVFRDFKYECPSMGISSITITKEMVLDPKKTIQSIKAHMKKVGAGLMDYISFQSHANT